MHQNVSQPKIDFWDNGGVGIDVGIDVIVWL